jgi:hypothetical protein
MTKRRESGGYVESDLLDDTPGGQDDKGRALH